jgi:endonuclease I
MKRFSFVFALLLFVSVLWAAVPAGYYATVDATNSATLRSTLHAIIKDHTRYPYTATTTDTWDILEKADEDPNDSGYIIDLYKNAKYIKYGAGNTDYNREHTWAKSYGFPDDNSLNYPYTDCHHLFLSNDSYNSSRSNKPYDNCSSGCTEKPTEVNDGRGGGIGVYPGNSNWTSGTYTDGSWETWNGRKGDVARALFYMAIRYEGGTHGITGAPEPDLELTDDRALIASSNTGNNESVGYMGMLSVLLEWNREDPVDSREEHRNDVVYSYQGNRNPFIDHPEYVDMIFGDGINAPYVYEIPHVAETNWNSNIIAYNPTDAAITFYLNKWDSAGVSEIEEMEFSVGSKKTLVIEQSTLGYLGIAQVLSQSPDLSVKLTYQYIGSESLCEFFIPRDTEGQQWMIPNSIKDWFDWFGLAVANHGTVQANVTFDAYKDGILVATSTQAIAPFTKVVAVSSGIWEGVDYRDVDMVVITSDQPIASPLSITGNSEQDRHVFFLGQGFGE